MKNSTLFSVSKLVFFITFLSFNLLTAQEDPIDILDSYEDYTSDAREVVYVHLNKSTYIKGESIGFTAYVLDKKDKKPSLVTTNLYVSIEDEKNNVLQKKLLKVENGVASNIIELDSSFTSGYYTFKAYTNWMRNFNEQNYFIESVRIIDPKAEEYLETANVENAIDAQFLPEGGHLLNGVINNVGVVLKDSKGYGVASVKGEVRDQKDNLVTQFEVNQFGIGKFPLLAEIGNSYKVNLSYLNKDYSFTLNEKIESIGVTMSLVNHKNKAIVSLTTNKESLKHIKNKPYSLTVHNGEKIEVLDIVFNNQLDILTVFDLEMLTPGVNILTLFNEKNQPIIERLFFNYNGIDVITSSNLSASKAGDSITMKLNFKDISAQQFNNLSVSVLPQETKSYGRHHNILSYTYLQPYVNGTIEQAKYYFTDISQEKQMELDNLLITQGWSSYDWQHIFKPAEYLTYPFEQGFTLRANVNKEVRGPSSKYMLHAIADQEPKLFEASETDKTFILENIFISEKDSMFLSEVKAKDLLSPAKLYLQSYPNEIPFLNTTKKVLNPKADYATLTGLKNKVIFENLNNIHELDEVVVETELDKIRVRMLELGQHSYGRIKIPTQLDRLNYYTLGAYLAQSNLSVSDGLGSFSASFRRNDRGSFGGNGVEGEAENGRLSNTGALMFLDGMQIMDTSIFSQMPMSNIDYVELDPSGFGMGIRGNQGVIKIYTLQGSAYKSVNRETAQKYSLPLTFSGKKKFYVPKYRYYNDDFYKGYGTISWKPELVTDANGDISIKIKQPEVPVTLYIEGIANDGSFIFEEKTISLNKSF
ncbi:hypothetical protein H8K90_04380 [Winogradskyella echinorum]|uniref:MG2 domain-containing protein n=1 Tax=Winogradskyella echinorum TaxID=538189 RepID=A0ABR6XYN7_9FLAO|nr:hypothetical protein [Winogradskyella echinorum]MBC3845603.1 hypothetical protein [Winogradskyella echinorum]MBC5749951.1 hypothetical protein [Winogradskyella echinorum]